jgi:hypothetical protein
MPEVTSKYANLRSPKIYEKHTGTFGKDLGVWYFLQRFYYVSIS